MSTNLAPMVDILDTPTKGKKSTGPFVCLRELILRNPLCKESCCIVLRKRKGPTQWPAQ